MLSCLHSHMHTCPREHGPSTCVIQGFPLPAVRQCAKKPCRRGGDWLLVTEAIRDPGATRGWDDDRWGPYSQASSGSAMQRLFNQALSTPLGDLSLDFDRSFINSRRRSCCIADATAIAEAELDEAVGQAERRTRSSRTAMMVERDARMCDVLLEFQSLVAGQSHVDSLITAADLLSRHTSHRSHTDVIKAEVQRMANLVHCQMAASTVIPSAKPASGFNSSSGTSPMQQVEQAVRPVSSKRAAALVQAINKVMYGGTEATGYCGNCHDFYHPDNHLMYKVVANKTGSPAALALLYWEVARRVGLPMEVMLFPGHTFLRPMVPGGSSWLVDPFNGGQVCSQQVVEARLNNNWGLAAPQLSLPDRYQPLATPPINSTANGVASPAHDGNKLQLSQAGTVAGPAAQVPQAQLEQQEQVQQQQQSFEVPLHSDVADVSGCSAQFELHTHGSSSSSSSDEEERVTGSARVGTFQDQEHQQGQGQEQQCCRAAGGISLQATSAPGALLLRLLCNQRESYFCPLPASGFMRWGGGTASAHLHQTLVWRGLWTTRLLRAMVPGTPYLVRDEGYALLQMGHTKEGMDLLRMYLRCAEGAEDLRRVQEFVVPD